MRKNVLFITSLFPHRANPFMATFNEKIVRALLSRVDGKVVAPVRKVPFVRLLKKMKVISSRADDRHFNDLMKGLQVYRPMLYLTPLVGRSLHWFFYFLSIYRTCSTLITAERIDCIYAMYAYPDGVASVLIGMAKNKKVVVHVMGCDINLFTRYFWRRLIIVWALRRATHIISVSEAMKKSLVELGIESKKITVVYNGVDRDIFRPRDREECRRLLSIPADERLVLFVGTLEEVKGVKTLLTAFNDLLGAGKSTENVYKLYLIGDGSLAGKLADEIKALHLASSVRMLGNRSSEEVALWMNACDVFCLPSIREGLPNVILEAMSCRRPIVASRVGGIPELLNSYEKGVLVDPHDSTDLGDKLSVMLKEEYIPVHSRAEITHTWDRFSAEIAAILGSIQERPL